MVISNLFGLKQNKAMIIFCGYPSGVSCARFHGGARDDDDRACAGFPF